MVLAAVPGLAQPQNAAAPDDTAQVPAQATQQPLDLQEAVARDVLEPLQAGMESHDLKQVLSVFDAQTVPNYPQLQDQIKALLDAYVTVRFRYKILQASSDDNHASMTCEIDLDATPVDSGQVPTRRSTQMRLQLTQAPKGWRISNLSPGDFFTQ
jgi:hypothetical protein